MLNTTRNCLAAELQPLPPVRSYTLGQMRQIWQILWQWRRDLRDISFGSQAFLLLLLWFAWNAWILTTGRDGSRLHSWGTVAALGGMGFAWLRLILQEQHVLTPLWRGGVWAVLIFWIGLLVTLTPKLLWPS